MREKVRGVWRKLINNKLQNSLSLINVNSITKYWVTIKEIDTFNVIKTVIVVDTQFA
jgi:hypothetical protein